VIYNNIIETIRESKILYSGVLARKVRLFFPGRQIVMGISIHDHQYKIWAIPKRYKGEDADIAVFEGDFKDLEEAVDSFLEFMQGSCKNAKDITLQYKIILKRGLQPNSAE